MSETARIESIAELRAFRVALVKFVDACNVALGDAESDMQRTYNWLERDQISYWNGQLAKRAEIVSRAKEAVRMKKLFKSPTGGTQSVVDEEKALRVAIRMHEEAEQKIVACKQWARRLQKEIMVYKGGVSRFTSVLGGEVPVALSKLDAMAAALEAYAALAAGGGGATGGAAPAGAFGGEGLGGMGRAPDAAPSRESFAPPDIAALRAAVPPDDVRTAAPETDVRDETWTIPPLPAETRRAVAALGHGTEPASPEATLVVAKGAWAATQIYCERRAPVGAADSGWYLASTNAPGIVALNTVRVVDVLEVRPDLRELLSLPEGYLAVMTGEGVRSIFTPQGEELWGRARSRSDDDSTTA